MLAQLLLKFGRKRAISKNFTDLFSELRYYNVSYIYTYLNGNQQINSKVGELKGKIWPNSITEHNINEAPLTWSVVEISRTKT